MLLRMTASPLRALPFWIDENLRGHTFYIRSATWTKTRDGPVLKLGSEVGCRITGRLAQLVERITCERNVSGLYMCGFESPAGQLKLLKMSFG